MLSRAVKTALYLIELYYENFGRETCEPFRITWPQLRYLATVPRLEKSFLKEVSEVLAKTDYGLIPFDDFLYFAKASDLSQHRAVPGRVLEEFHVGSWGLSGE